MKELDFEIKRMALKPGDVVVVKVDCSLTQEAAARLGEQVRDALPPTLGCKVVVLPRDTGLSVMSQWRLGDLLRAIRRQSLLGTSLGAL